MQTAVSDSIASGLAVAPRVSYDVVLSHASSSRVAGLRNSHDTEDMTSEPLGHRIKKERLALGMTQRDLADAVGITVPYISKIESCKETPTDEKLVTIAQVLGLNADELILAAGRMPADVMDRLAADPSKGLEFLRRIRK